MATATADRISELEVALKAKLDENDRYIASLTDETGKGNLVGSTEGRDTFRKNLKDAQEIKGMIEDLQSQDGLRSYSTKAAPGQGGGPASVALGAAAAGAPGMSPEVAAYAAALAAQSEFKDLGTRFTESQEFKDLIASGGATMRAPWEFQGRDLGGQWGQKDVYAALPTGPSIAPRFGRTQTDPMVLQAFRRTRVRDLFPVQATSANLIDFFRVTGFANAASVVPDRVGSVFGLKPQSTLTIVAAQAPVRTIAHFEVAHRNVLADEPQLQGLINNELLYGLRLHEDYQILQGTGTGDDLLGILNTPGIQGYTHDTAVRWGTAGTDNRADDIRRAATKAILAYYEPTGVIEHPYDWEETELAKDANGRYLVSGGVAIGADKTLWQMPVVDTPAMPQGTALVGAFGLGAQLYDREVGNIRVAEQHADFFIRNAVVVLAEERLALAVKRPESFVRVTF